MAAEIDHQHLHDLHDHQAFFERTARSCPELSIDSQHSEYESVSSVSISSIIDQGSVSFGRYATEALAWEKRSVFPHDRFQEELEKFKNPGLVAQKKAYFEEYYRKLRAMKALQAEQQEIAQHEACQNAHNSTTQIEKTANSTVLKDENNVSQLPISDNNTVRNLNSSSGGTVYDSEQATEAQRGKKALSTVKAGMNNRMSLSLSTVKGKHRRTKSSLSQTSSTGSTKTGPEKSPTSSAVNRKTNQPNKQVPGLQAKGTVASVRNKTMLENSRTMKNASKESEKPKPTLRKVIQKTVNSLYPSKKSDPKATSKIKRQIMEVFPYATVPNSLSAKDKQVSSFSSVKARMMKPSTTSQGLSGKLPTRLPVPAQSTKLVSSSSIRTCKMKPSTTSEGLTGKLPTRSSVHVQCAKPVSSTSSIRTTPVKPSTTSEGLAGKLPTRSSVNVPCAKPVSSFSSVRKHPVKPFTTPQGLVKKLPTRSSVHVPRAKPASSFSSVRKHPVKPSTNPQGLVEKLPTRSSVHVPCAKPASSFSSVRKHPVKPSRTPQGLVKKLPTKLPVNSQSSKSISKDKASTGGLRNLAKRSVNFSSPSKSNQSIGAEFGQKSLVQERKNKEGKEKVGTELRRDPKAASSAGPIRHPKPVSLMVSIFKTLHEKHKFPKIAPHESADEKHGRINTLSKSARRQDT